MTGFLTSRYSLKALSGLTTLAFALSAMPAHDAEAKGARPKKRTKSSQTIVRDTSSYIVMNHETGDVLAARNPDERIEPASLVKIMTLIVTFDAIRDKKLSLHQTIPMAYIDPKLIRDQAKLLRDPRTNRLIYNAGDPVVVEDMIKAAVVTSAADATLSLANAVAGSETAFVRRMNEKTAEILKFSTAAVEECGKRQSGQKPSTCFSNPHGMPGNQFSTARDFAKISQYLIRHYPKEYAAYFDLTHYHLTGKPYEMDGHNKLLAEFYCQGHAPLKLNYRCMDGIKTGYFRSINPLSGKRAGSCLAASMAWDKYRINTVIFNAPSAAIRNATVARLSREALMTLQDQNAPRTAKMPIPWPAALSKRPHIEQEEPEDAILPDSPMTQSAAPFAPPTLTTPAPYQAPLSLYNTPESPTVPHP